MPIENGVWRPRPGAFQWCTSAKVGAGRTETLWCGDFAVADVWVTEEAIHWELRSAPEIGIEPDSGSWDDDGRRSRWSEAGFADIRSMVNDRVRSNVRLELAQAR